MTPLPFWSFGDDGQGDLDVFLSTAQIAIVNLDRDQAELARTAYRRFGKGLGQVEG